MLRLNRKTVYEAVQSGQIPGAVRVGNTIRFSRDTVLAWLKASGGSLKPAVRR